MPKYYSEKRAISQEQKRTQIWNAFLKLINEKQLDDITIQEICDEAQIHRTTFYNHFYDVFDLVGWGVDRILIVLFAGDFHDVNDMADTIISLVTQYRRVFHNLMSTAYKENLQEVITEVFENRFLSIIENESINGIPSYTIVRFVIGGMTRLIIFWFKDPNPDTEQIKKEIKDMLRMISQQYPLQFTKDVRKDLR